MCWSSRLLVSSKPVGFVSSLGRFLLLLQVMAEGRIQGLKNNKWSVCFDAILSRENTPQEYGTLKPEIQSRRNV
jgi:hypothetical protein